MALEKVKKHDPHSTTSFIRMRVCGRYGMGSSAVGLMNGRFEVLVDVAVAFAGSS